MFLKYTGKVLAAAVLTAIAGTALANTTLDATTTGDLFLNIEDTSNNTSYLFDTGVAQASFNGNGSYSFDLSSDTNLTGFLNTKDTFLYSVVSATKTGAGPAAVSTIDITGNSTVTPVNTSNSANNQAQSPIKLFLAAANMVNTASTKSVVLATGSDWGQGLTEGVVSNQIYSVTQPPYGDEDALNTPLAFYNVSGSNASAFAHTWDFATTGDLLTYNPAPVPLPTPVLLLLSGLGMMGAVARRAKSTA